jgi:peptidoglycan/LPS O-acetylase OafA/YrhL
MTQSQGESPTHPGRDRLHQIDGLRAAACLMVVFAHCLAKPMGEYFARLGAAHAGNFLARLPASGVELFFVLSGVVLLRPYLRGEKRFDVWRYASRRFLRIYPPYWACLAVSVPLIMLVTRVPTWFSREILPTFRWRDVLAQVPLVGGAEVTYNAAWWSLEVEVLFYAVVPLIIAVGAKTAFRPWLAVALGSILALASLWSQSLVPPTLRDAVPLATSICRFAICFFMGIVIAKTDLSATAAKILVAMGLGLLTAAYVVPGTDPTAGFALLYGGLVAFVLRRNAWQRFFSQPLAVWLGERSYSIFLIHFTAFYVTNYVVSLFIPSRNLTYFLASRLIGLPLALFSAMILFEFVEKRFAHGLVTADCFWPGTYLAKRRSDAAAPWTTRRPVASPVE